MAEGIAQMAFKHNKKRNIGLLTEFVSQHISHCVLAQDEKGVDKAIVLWKNALRPGTEMNKEFLAFKALHGSKFKNKEIALKLMEQVKSHVKKLDNKKLETEKNAFIQNVNFKLNDPEFWNRSINEYKELASIQILLNYWKSNETLLESASDIASLEETVLSWLLREKKENEGDPSCLSMTQDDINGLAYQIMTNKFNSKYETSLNEDQKQIIKLFFGGSQEHQKQLVSKLEEIKSKALRIFEDAKSNEEFKKPLLEKLSSIKSILDEYDTSSINEATIKMYMIVSKFEKEYFNG